MSRFFKFAKTDHAQLAQNLGIVQVGSLQYYRRMELPPEIQDPFEGTRTLDVLVTSLIAKGENDPNAPALRKFGIDIQGDGIVRIENSRLINTFDLREVFVYSLQFCEEPDWKNFPSYNACLEVTDILKFTKILTNTLNSLIPVQFLLGSLVSYESRNHRSVNNFDLGVHPALIKEPNFSRDKEYRILWMPLERSNFCEKIIIGNTEIPSTLKLLKI